VDADEEGEVWHLEHVACHDDEKASSFSALLAAVGSAASRPTPQPPTPETKKKT
jgi:hypothetical protein